MDPDKKCVLIGFSIIFSIIGYCTIILNPEFQVSLFVIESLLFNLLSIFIFLSILVAFLFYLIITKVSRIIGDFGTYHKLKDKEDLSNSQLGEEMGKKLWEVFWRNIVLALLLFLTLSLILIPYISWRMETKSSDTIPSDLQNLTSVDLALLVIAIILPGFVLSLRILSNPTKRKPLIKNNIGKELDFILKSNELIPKIRVFKERVISFYFGFIATSIIVAFIIGYYELFQISQETEHFSKFNYKQILPTIHMTPEILLTLLIMDFCAICFATLFGEAYLKRYEPIDQI